MKIAFDIDGCVIDIMPRMEQELARRNIFIKNPESYRMDTEPKLNFDEWVNLWSIVHKEYQDTPPYPGAIEFLTHLHGVTQRPIHFITARNIRFATETHRLIQYYLKVPYTINFANRPFSKLDYMQNRLYMVEDNPEEITNLIRHKKIVIMPPRRWNKNFHAAITSEIGELWDYVGMFV